MKTFATSTFTILFLSFGFLMQAQDYALLAGSRSEGLAHSTVALDNEFAGFHNPSNLAWRENHFVGISVRNHYSLSDLNSAYLTVGGKALSGNIGATLQWYGNGGYHDGRLGIYYAQPFGEIFSASVSLNAYQHYIAGYDNNYAFSADVGFSAKLEKLSLGFYWGNVGQSEWNNGYNRVLPMYFRLGGSYAFSEAFLITGETVYDANSSNDHVSYVTPGNTFGLRGGIEYVFDEVLGLRFGLSSLPYLTSGGISLYLNKFRFDLSTSWNTHLGFSPHAGLVYEW